MNQQTTAESTASTAERAASAFLHRAIAEFERRLLTEEFDVVVADARVRVRIAGAALAAWARPALGWIRQPIAGTADAVVHVLSGAPFGPPPWQASDYDGGRVRGLERGSVLATFDLQHRIMNLYDRSTAVGVLWCDDPAAMPEWDLGAPLRVLLSWVLQDRGAHVVHAAGAGMPGRGGVLISGRGGSGKSTTALACVLAGMCTTGDDYCALTTSPVPAMHAVYAMAKVVPGSIGGGLVDMARAHSPRSDGKVHVGLEQWMVPDLELRAIVLPSVATATGSLQRISPRDALHRLAPSTLMQSVIGGDGVLGALGAALDALPAYTLAVGPDLDRVVHAVASLLP